MAERIAILNLGQSNAEPTASVSGGGAGYLDLVPDMNAFALTPDPALGTYYGLAVENIHILTFYNPEASASFPGGAPPSPFGSYTYDYYCKWLPWSIWEAGVNPAPTGFRYPNAFSLPKGPLGTPAYALSVNSMVDLARRVHGWLKKRVYLITLAVHGSQLQHKEPALAGLTKWGWFDPRIHNSWTPGDHNGLFARLRVVLTAAKVATEAEGDTLKIGLVTMKQGETDSQSDDALELWGTNAQGFVDAVRALIYELGLAEGSSAQVPFVWAGIPAIPWGTTATETINDALEAMQDDDPFFATYSTNGSEFTKNSGDPLHYNVGGIMALADADFTSWQAIRARTTLSMPLPDVPTLSELRTEVLRITERNTADAGQDSAVVTEAINDAYRDLINYVGDTCWWLRQVLRTTLVSGPLTPVALPRVVTRLLEIRPASYPGQTIDFSMTGHADNGRVQIITLDNVSESVDLHHMYEPRKLIADAEKPVLPAGYVEAVKVSAARRVVSVSGNATLEQKLRQEESRLFAQVSSHANKVDRQRRMRLTGRRGTRYRTGRWDSSYPWRE